MTASTFAFAGYAVAETRWLRVTHYKILPPGWPRGLRVRLAVIADVHACDPWMNAERLNGLVARTNMLGADAILLLGDYVPSARMKRFATALPDDVWAGVLGKLKAPLGVHAVLGNHDWWDDLSVQKRGSGPVPAGIALSKAGVPVYENQAVRLEKNGQPFWIAGLGDQWAFWPKRDDYDDFVEGGRVAYRGVHDVAATLAQVTDDAPVVLMAHEPDIFPDVPDRVALTISGHTHGGQVRIFGYTPVVPSKYGSRFAYGHIIEDNRHLVVSGGLGCSGLPIRFGSPPEIVVIDLGGGVGEA